VTGSVLVMAKAPVPGEAKTRLAGVAGVDGAADLAAASLLDTLEAAAAAFPTGHRVLALTGDLERACRQEALREAAAEWLVVRQGGLTFGERLVDGHRQAHRLAGGPVVQIGMDTPQVGPALLSGLAVQAHRSGRPVLGPAVDGGWWVLVTTHAAQAAVLAGVPMSRPDTGRLTAAALAADGNPATATVVLRDVDLPDDAEAVAGLAPHTRFAAAWHGLTAGSLDLTRTVRDRGAP
jgi:glycosyltransferase A (GT-A) superfamily protein (DUF2064 family)